MEEQLWLESSEQIRIRRKRLERNENSIAELKRLFIRIYEDNACGRLSDERFDMLSLTYETEQKQLETECVTLRQEIEVQERQNENVEKFIQTAHKYVGIDIKVEFHQPICHKQYSSLWYGGLVVSIKVSGCVFAIHACGDIYATLYDKSDGTELLYVKDKSNSGRFGVDVLPYAPIVEEMGTACKGTCEQGGECFKVSYNPLYREGISKDRLSALRAQYPDIYDEFVDQTESRIFKVVKSAIA